MMWISAVYSVSKTIKMSGYSSATALNQKTAAGPENDVRLPEEFFPMYFFW